MQTVGKSPSSAAVLAKGVLGPWYETTSEDHLPWLQSHGPIEALRERVVSLPHVTILPWLQSHGPIEAWSPWFAMPHPAGPSVAAKPRPH